MPSPAQLAAWHQLSESGAAASRYTDQQRIAQFWARVDKNGPLSPRDGTPCWLWTGATDGRGYGQLGVGGGRKANKRQRAHRFAYILVVGPFEGHLDHRTTCPKNCVNPGHLRPASCSQNLQNRAGATARSATGIRGVTWHKGAKKWRVTATLEGKQHHGGFFVDLEQAKVAAIELRNRLFTHNDVDRQ